MDEKIETAHEHDHGHAHGSHKQEFIIIGIAAVLLLLHWFEWLPSIGGIDTALLAALISGFPIVRAAVIAIIQQGDTKVGLLVSIAIVASIAIGEYFAAAEVAIIMSIGELLEHITVEKSNTSLQKLAELAPLKACLLTEQGERYVAAEDVQVGDRLLVKPGEKIPVDGIVENGQVTIDQSMITGEPLPVVKVIGDSLYGGTLVQLGSVEMTATKVGKDTALGHIIQMVEQAQQSKAPIARLIDRWANWFVPLSLAIALLVYLITGDLVRGVTILIVFCPCAMLLSTPTAVAAAIGTAARRGILIKGGEVLERAGKIDMLIFDKTGTVTLGRPTVKGIHCYGELQQEQVLAIAGGIEKRSEHHLAKAVLQAAASQQIVLQEPDQWEQVIGQGVSACYGSDRYLLGNVTLLKDHHITISPEQASYAKMQQQQGATVVFFVRNDTLAAIMSIIDPIREGMAETIIQLKAAGIGQVTMLTGDSTAAGNSVGNQVGIPSVIGDLLPGQKASLVSQYQQEGRFVAMVGDGINDAPALAQAHVGIAMGVGGTDVAIEAADIALLSDDLGKIATTVLLSRSALRTIQQNIIVANAINVVAIGVAAYGLLGPVGAAIVHNAGAILVVLNSARLLKYQDTAIASGYLTEKPATAAV
ncbi:cation-translocating P-type ATPase [bacterium BFN5]|nr:cation-translocating P-type ATPase [bacterium BFN5]QJW45435.1 cation-translocating P-type ATPase [bacterium BFN5]